MVSTNLAHKPTSNNPVNYKVYFLESVNNEIKQILEANFCNMTMPYKKWLLNFYATVEWIRKLNQWLSQLTYGCIYGSILLPNNIYQHDDTLGCLTYRHIKGADGNRMIVVTSIKFNPFIYKHTKILMEKINNREVILTESQLRRIIRESIKKVLNII